MDHILIRRFEDIRRKHRLRLDDSFDDQGHWVTINGTHVHINNAGDVDRGPDGLKKSLNRHKYTTKAEYQKEKAKALRRRDALLKRLDSDKEKRRAETIKKFGGSPMARRIAIRSDNSLTEEQKAAALEKVFEDQEKMTEENMKYSEKYNRLWNKIYDDYRMAFDPDYEFNKIEGDNGLSENAGRDIINPDLLFKNCQRCAMAYELRTRGYDVKVSPGESDALAQPANILQCFVNPERADFTEFDFDGDKKIAKGVLEQMKSWGDGSRAYVVAQYSDHGHAYNLINKGGRVMIQDSQVGLSWDVEDGDLTSSLNLSGAHDVLLIRTDNARLSMGIEAYVEDAA